MLMMLMIILLHSKEREIFRNIYNKRPDKTEEITKKN